MSGFLRRRNIMSERLICLLSVVLVLCCANVLPADEINEPAGSPATPAVTKPEREQPRAEPEKPKPAEISSGSDRLLRRDVFEIGPEIYSFKYEEPGLMDEEGIFYGGAFAYTYREWIPKSSGQSSSYSKKKRMARLEGRIAFGDVDYDGGIVNLETSETIPYTIQGIDDLALEGRLLFGADWLGDNTLNTLYLGLGYRYLNDDPSFDPFFYERESQYYYIPIGYEIDTNLRAGWSLAGRVEFDYLLWGVQNSHLSDVASSNPDFENDQDSGYGCRASIRFQYKSTNMNFAIEPFIRYWDIDKSEVTYRYYPLLFWEPKNKTTELGIQLIWMF
jgi:hypothetical protein